MPLNPLFASVPHPEDWRDGTGLLELIAICFDLALMLIPFCFVRGFLLKRSLSASCLEAWEFAVKGAVWGLLITVALVAFIGIPFGILNTIFLGVTGESFAWHLIVPSQLLLYGVFGFSLWKAGFGVKGRGITDAASTTTAQGSLLASSRRSDGQSH